MLERSVGRCYANRFVIFPIYKRLELKLEGMLLEFRALNPNGRLGGG
jgi:hypothetical protein